MSDPTGASGSGADPGAVVAPDPAQGDARRAERVADVVAALGAVAPLAKAAGWDPVGLQLGDDDAAASRVAVCHEVTEAVVARAVADAVDLLVTYHPLLFRPTTRLVADRSASGRAFRLIGAGVALAVVHTAYDVAAGGAADALAAALHLADVTPFGPSWGADAVKVVVFVPEDHADAVAAAMASAGAGTIGNYSACSFRSSGFGAFHAGDTTQPAAGTAGADNIEPEVRLEMVAPTSLLDRVVSSLVAAHPYEEPAFDVYEQRGNAGFVGRRGKLPDAAKLGDLAATVRQRLGGSLRIAGDREELIERVAVVPGSGGGFLAAAGNVDVIVTGDIGHHTARQALDRGVAVVDPGHAATERPGVASLYAAVARIVDDPVDLTGLDADPWEG